MKLKKLAAAILAAAMTVVVIPAFAAPDAPAVKAEFPSNKKSASLSLSGVSSQIYAVQLDLTVSGDLDFSFSPSAAGAFTTVKKSGGGTQLSIYIDSKTTPLNVAGKASIPLGKLTADRAFTLGTSAGLMLVNRGLEGAPYNAVSVTSTVESESGGGGGGGGTGGNKNNNTNGGTITIPPASATPVPGNTNQGFADISGHWAKASIELVTSKGLFKGTSETEFSPDMAMSRAMFVTVLNRFAGSVDAKWTLSAGDGASFEDVPADEWYSEAVFWAGGCGIAGGIGDNQFGPELAVSREQIAVLIVNYAKLCGVTLPEIAEAKEFTDAGAIDAWAVDAVNTAARAGLVTGRPDGSFDPLAQASRAEVSAILERLIDQTK